jgi:hypothetical protein
VFDVPVDGAIEWLVVRPHADDPAVVLLAPADDFPLTGQADVPLEPEFVDHPQTIRCGESVWIPATACSEHLRVGIVPDEAVAAVRRKLAALARGNLPDQPGVYRAEADPEYAAWMTRVALARETVERRTDTTPTSDEATVLRFDLFTPQPPPELAAKPEAALAANPGGSLLAAMAESLASSTPRYSEMPLRRGGVLLLTADASGVRVAWKGPEDAEPPPLTVSGFSGPVSAVWRRGTQPGVHRAEPGFPWVDGQVVLVTGSATPETLTVRL